ncbi:MAG: Hsp20/alpha crystallin family protein [Tildeniella nuda ZEHNDER 1965/U140]|jgi:HSP20 family protein|nr:Hsp20/alpha crystallin family protein [Tildeniella nuda ZEHNDER 1965/U140]
MLVRYWQPWREIESLRRQMDNVFDELTQNTNSEASWTPAVELKDNGNALLLRAQLPGVDAKDLDIQVTKEAVSLSGEHHHEQKAEKDGFFRSEFRYGKFQRVIPLPVAVQNDRVEAAYKDGILSLTLPKVEEVRNKAVKINLAGTEQPAATLEASNRT